VAKQHKYAIHADFLHFPTFNLSFNALIIGLLNLLLRFERFIRQHRLLRGATKHHIATSDGHKLKILQFNPAAGSQPAPAVIYFHGGAYVLTYASSHVYSVDCYAREANCQVFLVDYRLAHRSPFPTGFDDCCAALEWVAANAAQLGVDATRIAVMGDSAGGGLAAGVAQFSLDQRPAPEQKRDYQDAAPDANNVYPQACAQVLIYPTLDKSCSTLSATEFDDVPLWNGVSNRGMWEAYLRTVPAAEVPAYAAPADRKDLTNLPRAYIETAEFDPLRDEGIAYARRLEQAGVETQLNQTSNTIHGFDTVFSSAITQEAFKQRVEFLRAAFYPPHATATSSSSLATRS
jgi:acetyl esterase